MCDLEPEKICDNCGKCIENDSDYAEIEIDNIEIWENGLILRKSSRF